MSQTLHFIITGEWVTDFARTRFWQENQPLDNIINLLLNCMAGTDTPKQTLKAYAIDVLLGKRKFIGSTEDDSYALITEPNVSKQNTQKIIENEYNIPKYIYDSVYDSLIEYVSNNDYSETRNIIEDIKDEYGWLSPDGKFYQVDFGGHESWAHNYLLDEHADTFDDYAKYVVPDRKYPSYVDCLLYYQWILLHNPSMGYAYVTRNEFKQVTEKQKEFLYAYYMAHNNTTEAEKWRNYTD